MATSRFVSTDEIQVQQLKQNAKNQNTRSSTQTWMNLWQKWANDRGFNTKIEDYEPQNLDKTLQLFYAEIRTKDGHDYEPESLKTMLASLDRHLKECGYKFSIIRDREFAESKMVLEGKVKLLRQQGKGKRPNASKALTTEEEEKLWSENKLGNSSPKVLLQTMWWLLTQHFGLRGRQEHHSMEVQQFSFCFDDNGTEYITFKENPTKTRPGGLNSKQRLVLPKMFANGEERCPVQLFKQYLSRRPPELRESGPFYLASIENPKSDICYKQQKLGVNSIDNMMKNIIKNTSLETSKKRMTNHSARKTLVKKLRSANVERKSIIQVTGHANEKSLNDYDEGSEVEQQRLSNIISKTPHSEIALSQPASNLPFCTIPSAVSSKEQVQGHAYTMNNFQNCQVTLNIIQGQCKSPVSLQQKLD